MGTRTPTSSAPHAPRSRNWARTRLAPRRHPARRARREAIGLPRFGDPEDLKGVADSARWVGAPLGAAISTAGPRRLLPQVTAPAGTCQFRRSPDAASVPSPPPSPRGPARRERSGAYHRRAAAQGYRNRVDRVCLKLRREAGGGREGGGGAGRGGRRGRGRGRGTGRGVGRRWGGGAWGF